MANLDMNFKNEVAARAGGERVLNCFLCGTCTAGCPISELAEDYNPRRIMRKILAGMKEDVLSSGEIWKCYQCHTCVAHCPQDVRFADIIRTLREMAVEEGACDPALPEKVASLDEKHRKELLSEVNGLMGKKSKAKA
ncbi:4Fe-4S dicluster domain-containing protein [Clostridia bacterium OttesenSCG-928-O13]|nr:4Fe-4S dicluster domain-containing protein [Clostridia bacterium OttesenSCG-928-O13]